MICVASPILDVVNMARPMPMGEHRAGAAAVQKAKS